MKNNMKKTLLTAAFGCAFITGAFADINSNGGPFNMVINDYISLMPNGIFPSTPTITFHNPNEMSAGQLTGAQTFTVSASRDWNVKVSASNFKKDVNDAGIPAQNLYAVASSNGSTGVVTSSGAFLPVTSVGVQVAGKNTGQVSSTFDLQGRITPGFDNGNLTGTYTSNVSILATLN